MINKIIDAISMALAEEFGEGYEIYTESIEQGLTEPCFSIVCVNPDINQFFGSRYKRKNSFCIHFFPVSGTDKRSEGFEVSERIFNCLELLKFENSNIRGTNFRVEIDEEVFHFFIDYDLFVYSNKSKEEAMDTVDHKTGVRE